jgi:hypothetical protein
MKIFLFAVIAVLLIQSPEARNASGSVLRNTANILDKRDNTFSQSKKNFNIQISNPFHTN